MRYLNWFSLSNDEIEIPHEWKKQVQYWLNIFRYPYSCNLEFILCSHGLVAILAQVLVNIYNYSLCCPLMSQYHPLDPLGSPSRWFERISVIVRLMCNPAFSEFHDTHNIDWTPIIGDNQFNYPEISFSTNRKILKVSLAG